MKNLSIPDFRRRTVPLSVAEWDYADLDITPDDHVGIFNRNRLPELIDFCSRHPQYHIISFLNYSPVVRINAPIESAAFFMLGSGDKDPELMHIPKMKKESIEILKILEFDRD